MPNNRRFKAIIVAVASVALLGAAGAAQVQHTPTAAPQQMSQREVSELQDQLLQLIRVSPTLAEVVARDPSLLSNAEYVNRNNPELERFLQAHPEVAQNPDFYLFNNLHGEHEPASQTLERKMWPEMSNENQARSPVTMELVNDGIPFLVFVGITLALLWLTQVLLENRRWNRIFNLQSDVHGKLIEKFGTSQEVLTYMSTESGKKFLEATPIAAGMERKTPVPSPVARVLTPLQIGVVLTLLGIGLIALRHSVPEGDSPLLVIGTVVLMPGLGFIISAGIAYVMGKHLGLMPDRGAQN